MVESRSTTSQDFVDAFQLSTTRDELIEIRQIVIGWQDRARCDADLDIPTFTLGNKPGTLTAAGDIVPTRAAEACFAAIVTMLDERFDNLGLKRIPPKMMRPKPTDAEIVKQVHGANRAAVKKRGAR